MDKNSDGLSLSNATNVLSVFQQSKVVADKILYGHEARVWSSVIIRRTGVISLIATLGEDSRICLWDFGNGQLVSKIDAHPGASIWAGDWNSKCLV